MCPTNWFLWKSGKRKSTNPGGGHGKHEEEGALIDSELFGLRAKCCVYLDPRCQGKHATPTVEDGGGSTSRDRKLASVGGKTDGAKFRAVLQTWHWGRGSPSRRKMTLNTATATVATVYFKPYSYDQITQSPDPLSVKNLWQEFRIIQSFHPIWPIWSYFAKKNGQKLQSLV